MSDLYASTSNVTSINQESSQPQKVIFIVGYQDFSIDGMASLLRDQEDLYMISCVEPGEACMSRLALNTPDILLIQNDALKEPVESFLLGIFREYPGIRVLVFGKEMDDKHLFRLVRAGVHGYINEHMSGKHIKHALDCVLEGNTWIERHIMERFISLQHNVDDLMVSQFQQKIEQLCTILTKREIEILCQVVKGLAIKQIADEVHLSHQGVKMHLAKLFKKFNVTNRNQLILATFDTVSPVEELSTLLQGGLDRNLQHINASA